MQEVTPPNFLPGPRQEETCLVPKLDCERHRLAECLPLMELGWGDRQGQVFGGRPSKLPGEAVPGAQGLR